MIESCTPLGRMVDFLRANPYVTKEQYMWEWTLPQVNLATMDFTHTVYLSEKQAEKMNAKKFDNPEDLMNDFGLPVFK